MLVKLKEIAKEILPNKVYDFLTRFYLRVIESFESILFKFRLRQVQKNHLKALGIVRNKKIIKVAFFLIHESVWKYEGLYRLMESDNRYEPVVIICPYTSYGEINMIQEMNHAYSSFKEKKYNVIKSFNEKSMVWLNVNREIKPDLIFFSNPYFLTSKEYYIFNNLKHLTFYVPYSYMITNRPQMQYNLHFHNLVFKIFYESTYQSGQAKLYAKNKGVNSIVSGYPGLDHLLFNGGKTKSDNIWKKDRTFKRIIWAPHHTIEIDNNPFNYSNFLDYYEYFLELAENYSNEIVFSFKPHPILKSKLKKHPDWGELRTEQYYQEWESRPNCQLDEGDYYDLFLTSDALIHDSGSFIVEYLSTNKPCLYMVRNELLLNGFSHLGQEFLKGYYQSRAKVEIESFIREVILAGKDTLINKRNELIKCYLMPPNGISATQNIYKEINSLFNNN